jgi:DNA-binding XRE family transcriptional regulator
MDASPFCKVTLQRKRCSQGPYFCQVKRYPATPKSIGEMIRKRRLDLGLRQIDVARIIGCDEMSVVNWEKGHTSPRSTLMAGVTRFLGFEPRQDT